MKFLRHFLIFLILRATHAQKNQTVLHEMLSEKQKLEFEEEMMNLLDIPEKPQNVSRYLPIVKRSAPMFLMDVYNMMDDHEPQMLTDFDESSFNIFDKRGHNLQTIKDSNLILSLAGQNSKFEGVVKSEKVKRLWFNISHVSSNDKILKVELRLFRNIEHVSLKRNQGPITISVYRVASNRDEDGNRKLIFVDSVNTSEKNGWVILNVTESLHQWVYRSEPNRGFYLKAYSNDRPHVDIKLENAGIVGFVDDLARQPFMVGYIKRIDQRRKRTIESYYGNQNSYFEELRFQSIPTPCKRERMFVNFTKLNWQDFIIAPKAYEAYYCHGDCNFPFANGIPVTNHAAIQALINLSNSSIPKPCCAPIEVKPIKLIYQLSENAYAFRDKKDMVVMNCGCH